jgi:hypothetical protein
LQLSGLQKPHNVTNDTQTASEVPDFRTSGHRRSLTQAPADVPVSVPHADKGRATTPPHVVSLRCRRIQPATNADSPARGAHPLTLNRDVLESNADTTAHAHCPVADAMTPMEGRDCRA